MSDYKKILVERTGTVTLEKAFSKIDPKEGYVKLRKHLDLKEDAKKTKAELNEKIRDLEN
jgi:hypothetical protein